jgi:plastocyanin
VVVRVDGLNYAFAPSALSVKVGAAVTWKNETIEPHTVTSFQRGLFVRVLNPHKNTALTFRHIGTYRYYCGYHPYMRGVVIVHR